MCVCVWCVCGMWCGVCGVCVLYVQVISSSSFVCNRMIRKNNTRQNKKTHRQTSKNSARIMYKNWLYASNIAALGSLEVFKCF